MNSIAPYNFIHVVAHKVLDLLVNRKAMLYTAGTVFYLWQRGDRIIVSFDPNAIDHKRVDEAFAHALSTNLRGRLVVRTNSRGIFLQVGFETPPAPMPLESQSLDLNQQPSPFHMPIGITRDGALWISLIDGDSFLVGGSRRMGKSGLTHGMIQALLQGGKTDVYAWDGKGGLEYQAYIGRPNFHFMSNAERGLQQLSNLLAARLEQLKGSGYVNIIKHNESGGEFIQPIALFVDEIAMLQDHLKEELKRMIEYYGAAGLYSVLATNNPTQAAILVKSNLSTRICLPVPSFSDSLTVLGMKGAETLTERGRGLVIWDGRLTEFQSFQVTYPTPTDEQRRMLAQLVLDGPKSEPKPNVEQKIREILIRMIAEDNVSLRRAEREAYGAIRGGSYFNKVQQIYRDLKTEHGTTTTDTLPDSEPVAA